MAHGMKFSTMQMAGQTAGGVPAQPIETGTIGFGISQGRLRLPLVNKERQGEPLLSPIITIEGATALYLSLLKVLRFRLASIWGHYACTKENPPDPAIGTRKRWTSPGHMG